MQGNRKLVDIAFAVHQMQPPRHVFGTAFLHPALILVHPVTGLQVTCAHSIVLLPAISTFRCWI